MNKYTNHLAEISLFFKDFLFFCNNLYYRVRMVRFWEDKDVKRQ